MIRRSWLALNWLGGTASTPGLGFDARSRSGQFVNIVSEGTQNRQSLSGRNDALVTPSANASVFYPPEMRNALVRNSRIAQPKSRGSKWSRALRADVYDELLKLPLRFALHDFAVLQRHLSNNLATRGYLAALSGSHDAADSSNASGAGKDEGGGDTGVYTFHKGRTAAAADGQDAQHPFYAVAGRVSSVGYAPPLGPADPLDVLPFFVHRTSNGQLPGTLHSMHARNLMPAFVLKIENSVEGDLFRFEEELMKIFPTKKIFVRSHCIYVYNVGKDGQMVLQHWLLGLGF